MEEGNMMAMDEEAKLMGDAPEEKKEEKIVIEPINYEFLNGLRGIGAFSVYLLHFMEHFFN